ncbi:MoxR family ATPase [Deltaproteobacteria bacterium OttesenSCG-928-M10]|nr:MoxR family ATPase [Deltaproteobacteria bacterium OttesenSCG-928-M10]
MDLQHVGAIIKAIRGEVGKTIVGQAEAVELLLTSLLCGGHVLLEGVPGTGKTFLVQSFAVSLSLQFGRIQFTPDMMPGDVLGTNLFNFQTNTFVLTQGPIFTQILLADEINRTPPKTQAALLQAMNERAVTIDKTTYNLGDEFMVVATQNPIEQQGTYPLPEAQLDRFLFKVVIGYPSRDEEREIVSRHGHYSAMPKIADFGLRPVAGKEHIAYARNLTARIRLTEPLVDYIVDIIRATRQHPAVETGASSRAANMMASAARAYAAVCGRDFVIPDDIKRLAVPLLRHRIVMTPAADIEGITSDQAIGAIVDQTAAPR